MRIGIFESHSDIAEFAANQIIDKFAAKPNAVLGVATGSTPLGLYQALREAHQRGRFDLSNNQAFALDEYVGLTPGHPESYRAVLERELVGPEKTGLTFEGLHTPDGQATDLPAAAAAYDQAIKDSGGIDLQILGIGVDGHIGFNEPGGALDSRTHLGTLTEQTRKDNARFFDDQIDQVPRQCLTQGLGTILDAGELVLLALGMNKAKAIHDTILGPVDDQCPASVVQRHPNVTILLDRDAASLLPHPERYFGQVIDLVE